MNFARLSIGFVSRRIAVAGLAVTAGLCAAATPAEAQALQHINPPGMFTPRTYTHVVRVGNLLFLSGQVGFDEQAKLVGPTMREQIEQTLKNMKTALASQKADFSHVAKVTFFVTNIDEFRAQDVQDIRAKYFGTSKPASTLVQVVRLAEPDIKIEIEATAAVP